MEENASIPSVSEAAIISAGPSVPPSSPVSASSDWQIEHLISSAFKRTKERLLGYFLAIVVNFGLILAACLGMLVLGGIFFLIYSLTKAIFLGIALGIVFFIILILVFIYVSSWGQLAIIEVLIQEEKVGVIRTFKKVKPLVWGYFFFTAFSSVFFLGLLPFGVLSLGVIWLIWAVWGVFGAFVYLKQKRKGLENLWISKQMVGQKFWGIVGRLALIYGSIWFIQILFMGSGNNSLRFMTTIISFLSGPFVLSYSFEMYKNLNVPQEVKKPKVWMILSVIGWIIVPFALFFILSYLSGFLQNISAPYPPAMFSSPLPTI